MDVRALAARIAVDATRDLGRALSLVENEAPGFEQLLVELRPRIGRAYRVGVTGPPGGGKSTLVQGLVRAWRGRGRTVAVVAVDPSSPRSGGALLGDRIRMNRVALDRGVYIRSMASRGALGGLARTTRAACDVLDAAGFERIVVETVGVGQSEMDVVAATDLTVLVLVPEAGDGIQTLKSGLMEVADLFVVNKADRPGAARFAREIEAGLAITGARDGGPERRAVLTTVATEGTGVEDVIEAVERNRPEPG